MIAITKEMKICPIEGGAVLLHLAPEGRTHGCLYNFAQMTAEPRKAVDDIDV